MVATGSSIPFCDRFNEFVLRHEVAWELAFAALAVVFVAMAFVPVTPEQEDALGFVEWAITAVFAAEFLARFYATRARRAYLRSHWIDLISVVPPARWLRPFRLLRLLRLVRAFAGIGRAMTHVQRMANHRGLLWMIVAWLGVMVLTSMGFYAAENGFNSAVQSPLDALWWGLVTMTTVGYGEIYPKTAEGRVAAAVLLVLGIALSTPRSSPASPATSSDMTPISPKGWSPTSNGLPACTRMAT
jgi:voltage-gated potassium channel